MTQKEYAELVDVYSLDSGDYWDHAPDRLRWAVVGANAMEQGLALHVLGEEDDLSAPIVEMLRLPPNYVLSRHFHTSHRLEIVLQGSVTIEDRTFGPGDIFITKPNEEYGPLTAGPEGCLSAEIFSDSGGVDATFDMSSVDEPRRALLKAAGAAIRGLKPAADATG
jgi:ChrR Cupin-like domain